MSELLLISDLIGAVIMLMVSLIVIAYMASKMLNLPKLELFAKMELYEIFISALIVLFAFGLFLFASQLSISWSGGNPFEIARAYHSTAMIKSIYPSITHCYTEIMIYSTLSTMQIRPSDAVWTWLFKVAPGAEMIVGVFNLLVYGLVIVMSSLNAHMLILTIIESTMYSVFLPAGVLLRFFPPTRKAGTFIMVMAIAFYSVYPTTYAMYLKVLDKVAVIESGNPNATYDPSITTNGPSLLNVIGPIITASAVNKVSSGVSDVAPGLGAIAQFTGMISSESTIIAIQPALYTPIIDAIANLSLISFFMPALSMVITIAFINGMMEFIEQKVE